jgi:hypothetical protein
LVQQEEEKEETIIEEEDAGEKEWMRYITHMAFPYSGGANLKWNHSRRMMRLRDAQALVFKNQPLSSRSTKSSNNHKLLNQAWIHSPPCVVFFRLVQNDMHAPKDCYCDYESMRQARTTTLASYSLESA